MTVALRNVVYLHAVLPKHDGERSSCGSFLAREMTTVEVKTFVPARDLDQSKKFYQHLGFELAWSDGSLAYFRHGNSSFLLQNLYNKDHADNFMMHLLVVDVEAWWQHVRDQDLMNNYNIKAEPPVNRPWGIRDFIISDPNGIVWRIGQSIDVKGKSTS
jgi:catechol 2,3-dioxygenase-like lactoylglutathione lyase family enzyme